MIQILELFGGIGSPRKALKDTFFYRMCDKFAMKIEIFSENIKNK